MFNTIPLRRPVTQLLDKIETPPDLRKLEQNQLGQIAEELREYLLYTVGQTGGHFGAGLGVVELTVALHYVLNTPEDLIVWDVGHQSYPHKIITGRREAMASIRQWKGISGFPKRNESHYDAFGGGHSSTSISAALGMAEASKLKNLERQTVAVIGDGALTAGMAFEAINHAARSYNDILIILNDNDMSISKSVSGLAAYFSKACEPDEGRKPALSKMHQTQKPAPKTIFEGLGFPYVGPIDGHDLESLIGHLRKMIAIKGPKILHLLTQKGHGFAPAECDPVGYHALDKIESTSEVKNSEVKHAKKYQEVFGDWLCDMAAADNKLVGITPAMCKGSGMLEFAEKFSGRFHDVAIAEQHALTFAAGLACEGLKPVVAIYSTFLQRAYDQLIHDIALQNLDVTFAVDRAGLVGEDGPTHAGSFDISFMRAVPNLTIATPSDENECRQLLFAAYRRDGPAAVRYPRGAGIGRATVREDLNYPVGKGKLVRKGHRVCILNFGALLVDAKAVAENYHYSLCDMRWVKPLDESLILEQATKHEYIVTVEENTVAGGAGAGVMECLHAQGFNLPVLAIGLPDKFIEHGKRSELLDYTNLTSQGIDKQICKWLDKLTNRSPAITKVNHCI